MNFRLPDAVSNTSVSPSLFVGKMFTTVQQKTEKRILCNIPEYCITFPTFLQCSEFINFMIDVESINVSNSDLIFAEGHLGKIGNVHENERQLKDEVVIPFFEHFLSGSSLEYQSLK